ncbi:MAG TPA: hypothetical protein VEU96_26160 [Bryobacteraceae bacterium]|nr:hypothetical protein [Bryobacteraceae bacterium]
MEINPDDFRRLYQSLSDSALQALNRDELVDVARECYDSELASRGLKPVHAASEIEQGEKPADTQGMVEVANFPSFQAASLARAMLTSADIPVVFENESFVTGGVRLMVPPELLDEAREVLDNPISDDELAAQAEAEPPPEDAATGS